MGTGSAKSPDGETLREAIHAKDVARAERILATIANRSADVRMMLTTGVMGGFTTYSTFNYETTEFLREGAWPLAAANVLGTVAICLAAGFAGVAAARMIVGR